MKNIILFAVTVSVLSCNTKSSSFSNQFDAIFDSVFKADEPGGAVLIAKNGKIIYEKGFGIEDIKTKKPISSHTLFNVGSISKTFVAYGICSWQKKTSFHLTMTFTNTSPILEILRSQKK